MQPQSSALEITVLWQGDILETVQVRDRREIIVSSDRRKSADLYAEVELPAERWAVARNFGDHAVLHTLAGDVPLAQGERREFTVGPLTFAAQFVAIRGALGKSDRDWSFLRLFGLSFLVHAFFVTNALLITQTAGLADGVQRFAGKFYEGIYLSPPEKIRPPTPMRLKEGRRAPKEEGAFGAKNKPPRDTRLAKGGAPKVDPNKRLRDREKAQRSGLLGLLRERSGLSQASVFNGGGFGGVNNSLDGLRGAVACNDEDGCAGGAGGLGTRGNGPGGGGGPLDIGGIGTGTHGDGPGDFVARPGVHKPTLIPGKKVITDNISKIEISRVIRNALSRFKFCYEKELNANPNLQGKVAVKFTIAPTGVVAMADAVDSTIGDPRVEECVVSVMKSLQFPRPRGGGVAVVTYPFIFAAN